jgi:hypothetical protein
MTLPMQAVRALMGMLLAAPALHAQDPEPWPELREADIPALIATLRTVTGADDAARAAGHDLQRRAEDLHSGRVDPLELFHRFVPAFPVPDGARYVAACSRAISNLAPIVFLTFDRPTGGSDPAREATRAHEILRRTIRFYEAAGFSYNEHFNRFDAPDESFSLSFEPTPPTGFLEQYPDCADGPFLMASFGPAANQRYLGAGPTDTPPTTPMSDDAFALASMALITAWQDSRDSAELEAMRAELSRPADPGDAEGRRIAGRILAFRERNLAVFRRHAATLAPLVQRYLEAAH